MILYFGCWYSCNDQSYLWIVVSRSKTCCFWKIDVGPTRFLSNSQPWTHLLSYIYPLANYRDVYLGRSAFHSLCIIFLIGWWVFQSIGRRFRRLISIKNLNLVFFLYLVSHCFQDIIIVNPILRLQLSLESRIAHICWKTCWWDMRILLVCYFNLHSTSDRSGTTIHMVWPFWKRLKFLIYFRILEHLLCLVS